ncbi:inner nuclear membrane protein enriched at telomere/subtelomere region [Polyrhizophydium stewartii]|uniref:Inner nuclear membrane protein enriched at telomere/subtelomere region n=1 Tax=Polyrhizophydium stewartii TaxID=2732419 RepID=A0ABR4N8J3_9FUNG|nr:hypothetical protein HK105_004679 [Polyrhizophydium stewartii]
MSGSHSDSGDGLHRHDESGALPDYLAAAFDPARATVQQLVRILARHQVALPPSRQRKDHYVDLFRTHIAPRLDELRQAAARIAPRAPRISLVGAAAADYDDDDTLAAAAAAAAAAISDADDAALRGGRTPRRRSQAPQTPARRSVRSVAAPYSSGVDSDADADLAAAAGSRQQPAIASQTPRASAHQAFSDNNQFQSPPHRSTAPATARRTSTKTAAAADGANVFSGDNPFQSPTKPVVSGLVSPRHRRAKSKSHQDPLEAPAPVTAAAPASFGFDGPDDDGTIGSPAIWASAHSGLATAHKPPAAVPVTPATFDSIMRDLDGLHAATPGKQARRRGTAGRDGSSGDAGSASSHRVAGTPAMSAAGSPTSDRTRPYMRRKPRLASNNSITREMVVQGMLVVGSAALAIFAALAAHWQIAVHPDLAYCPADPLQWPAPKPYEGWNPLGYLVPPCVSCPEHAVCSPRNVTACTGDHIRHHSPWAAIVGQDSPTAFPIGQAMCVPDAERLEKEARRQQAIAVLYGILDDVVRSWVGKAECGDIKPTQDTRFAWSARPDTFGHRPVLGMPLAIARSHLRTSVPESWSDDRFEEYWKAVFAIVVSPPPQYPSSGSGSSQAQTSGAPAPPKLDSLTTILDDTAHQHRLLVSSNPPVVSMSCRVRRHIWSMALKYSLQITLTCGAIVIGMLGYIMRQQHLQERRIVAVLVEDVMDMVHGESENHHRDPARFPAPGLSIAHVQDHLLPSVAIDAPSLPASEDLDLPYATHKDPAGHTIWTIPDAHVRKRLWGLVTAEVARLTSIRKTVMEVKGQPQDLWMWVASPALSPRRSRSALSNAAAARAAASASPATSKQHVVAY